MDSCRGTAERRRCRGDLLGGPAAARGRQRDHRDRSDRRRPGRGRTGGRSTASWCGPRGPTVSAFCTELTGLTQDEVDAGAGFAEACRELAARHRAGERPWASWGDYDRHQFTRQCAATTTPYPFGRRHTNAKAVFTAAYGLRKRPGMAQALRLAGTAPGGQASPGRGRRVEHRRADPRAGRSGVPGRDGSRAVSCGDRARMLARAAPPRRVTVPRHGVRPVHPEGLFRRAVAANGCGRRCVGENLGRT